MVAENQLMKGSYMGHNRNTTYNTKVQVLIQPKIGLDSNSHQAVVKILNITLADEAVLCMKTRNAHWNVHGAGFYDRHTLFDVQYKQLNDISDEISKRARVLGGLPMGTFEEYLKNTRLVEQPGNVPDIQELLADHEAAIRFLREDARKCSEEYEDEGTFELLVSIMRVHEKMAWMLRSYIESAPLYDEI
jgi:starvation-inducible DNA-binding protein